MGRSNGSWLGWCGQGNGQPIVRFIGWGDCLSVCLGAVGLLEAIPWGILYKVRGREGDKYRQRQATY